MPITVPMIEEKEFKTKVRGYDPVEVDEFLDEICDEMIVMQEEIARLQAQLAQTKRDLAYVQPAPQRPAPAPAPVQDVSESAQKLMANAQRLYDETIAQAKEEAAAIVAKAQGSVSSELTEEKAALEQQVSDMHVNAKAYRDKIIGLMDELRSMLDAADLD
ncbi:MAG: DivIVA domain-containing protein [Clostridia bacterium]|nr:DivIVA domain-containing protein [Clostridia bacterium]